MKTVAGSSASIRPRGRTQMLPKSEDTWLSSYMSGGPQEAKHNVPTDVWW